MRFGVGMGQARPNEGAGEVGQFAELLVGGLPGFFDGGELGSQANGNVLLLAISGSKN